MSLLQEVLDACVVLTKRVEHLEYDKVAQALEITKLKKRVKKLKKGNRVGVLKLRMLKRVRTSQRIDTSNDTVTCQPILLNMLHPQEIEEGGDKEEHVEDVTAGDDAQGDDTAAHREVPTVS
nr:hypothetical protein [Tanacetum cinerariifolium]